MNAQSLLLELDSLYAELTLMRKSRAEAEKSVIPNEVQAKLDEIAEEFDGKEVSALKVIAEKEEQAKQAVLQAGETVSVEGLQAVYSKGRITWDTQALEGYRQAHPELNQFRKQGSPSVTLRRR